MSTEEIVLAKLKDEGVSFSSADLAAVVACYAGYCAGRPLVEAMLTLTDEPAIAFSAAGQAT